MINHPTPKDPSGLSIRLSETLLGVIISAGISFGAGFAVANTNAQKQTQTQSISCAIPNPVSQPKSGAAKH